MSTSFFFSSVGGLVSMGILRFSLLLPSCPGSAVLATAASRFLRRLARGLRMRAHRMTIPSKSYGKQKSECFTEA